MSSQEIPITLTPQQATLGVILKHTLPTGPARLRIPPCRDGELVRVRVGAEEVLLRIRVTGAAAAPPPGPAPTVVTPAAFGPTAFGTPGPPGPLGPPGRAPRSGTRGWLVALGVVPALILGFVLLNSGKGDGGGDGSDSKAAGTPSPSYSTASPYPTYAPAPTPTYSATPTHEATTEPAAPDPVLPSSPAAPTPFDKGTCLNGELPDSTTAQRVSDVEEVPCSASDAHYRVIESIPMTSDLDQCNDNPKTEYAFSYRYTLNGAVINQYVYCLVGIGSYAR